MDPSETKDSAREGKKGNSRITVEVSNVSIPTSPTLKSTSSIDDSRVHFYFKVGMDVEANFNGQGGWYPGVIRVEREDGTFDVEYDYGDIETMIHPERLRPVGANAAQLGIPPTHGDGLSARSSFSNFPYHSPVNGVSNPMNYYAYGDNDSVLSMEELGSLGEASQTVLSPRGGDILLLQTPLLPFQSYKSPDAEGDIVDVVAPQDEVQEIVVPLFRNEDRVEANYFSRGVWYRGEIIKVRVGTNNVSYDVAYEDGEIEIRVEEHLIRPLAEFPSPKNAELETGSNSRSRSQLMSAPLVAEPDEELFVPTKEDVVVEPVVVSAVPEEVKPTPTTAQSEPVQQPVTSALPEGSRVEANYMGRGKWYPGTVQRVRSEAAQESGQVVQSFDVAYDDGEIEVRVEEANVRKLESEPPRPAPNVPAPIVIEVSEKKLPALAALLTPSSASAITQMVAAVSATMVATDMAAKQRVKSLSASADAAASSSKSGRPPFDRQVAEEEVTVQPATTASEPDAPVEVEAEPENSVESAKQAEVPTENMGTSVAVAMLASGLSAKTRAKSVESGLVLVEGTRVEANYMNRGKWYPGTVQRVRSEQARDSDRIVMSYDVAYDDGEIEVRLERDQLRKLDGNAPSRDIKTPTPPVVEDVPAAEPQPQAPVVEVTDTEASRAETRKSLSRPTSASFVAQVLGSVTATVAADISAKQLSEVPEVPAQQSQGELPSAMEEQASLQQPTEPLVLESAEPAVASMAPEPNDQSEAPVLNEHAQLFADQVSSMLADSDHTAKQRARSLALTEGVSPSQLLSAESSIENVDPTTIIDDVPAEVTDAPACPIEHMDTSVSVTMLASGLSAKIRAKSVESGLVLVEGTRVEANYLNRGKWYPGTVQRVRSEQARDSDRIVMSYDVAYDDGEIEVRLERDQLRKLDGSEKHTDKTEEAAAVEAPSAPKEASPRPQEADAPAPAATEPTVEVEPVAVAAPVAVEEQPHSLESIEHGVEDFVRHTVSHAIDDVLQTTQRHIEELVEQRRSPVPMLEEPESVTSQPDTAANIPVPEPITTHLSDRADDAEDISYTPMSTKTPHTTPMSTRHHSLESVEHGVEAFIQHTVSDALDDVLHHSHKHRDELAGTSNTEEPTQVAEEVVAPVVESKSEAVEEKEPEQPAAEASVPAPAPVVAHSLESIEHGVESFIQHTVADAVDDVVHHSHKHVDEAEGKVSEPPVEERKTEQKEPEPVHEPAPAPEPEQKQEEAVPTASPVAVPELSPAAVADLEALRAVAATYTGPLVSQRKAIRELQDVHSAQRKSLDQSIQAVGEWKNTLQQKQLNLNHATRKAKTFAADLQDFIQKSAASTAAASQKQ